MGPLILAVVFVLVFLPVGWPQPPLSSAGLRVCPSPYPLAVLTFIFKAHFFQALPLFSPFDSSLLELVYSQFGSCWLSCTGSFIVWAAPRVPGAGQLLDSGVRLALDPWASSGEGTRRSGRGLRVRGGVPFHPPLWLQRALPFEQVPYFHRFCLFCDEVNGVGSSHNRWRQLLVLPG